MWLGGGQEESEGVAADGGWILILIMLCTISSARMARGEALRGMVSSVHPAATEAGLRALQEGGNAMDAAVAVALTLGVVDSDNSGIGGGCFMLIRLGDGSLAAIDGRETAPAAATPNMFVRNGKGDTALSQTGPLASGVPGALAAYEFAVEHYGQEEAEGTDPAGGGCGGEGFSARRRLRPEFRSGWQGTWGGFRLRGRCSSKATGHCGEGELLKQTRLAATYRSIAQQGSGLVLPRAVREAAEQWMKANGGIMTAEDFRNYQIKLREPIRSDYRGFQIVTFPPPSSGGVHVAADSATSWRTSTWPRWTQATRLHVDRRGDEAGLCGPGVLAGGSGFCKRPARAGGQALRRGLAAKINRERATPVKGHGMPPDWQTDVFQKHTTHFSVGGCGRELGGLHGDGQHQLRLESGHSRHGRGDE